MLLLYYYYTMVVVVMMVLIPFEQKEPDYLLWAPLRSSFASSSTPAGCLLQLKHGLDEGARGAKSHRKKSNKQRTDFLGPDTRLVQIIPT